MKKYYFLSIATFFLLSGTVLFAQWKNEYLNPISSPALNHKNSDPSQQYRLSKFASGPDHLGTLPEYQILEINLFGTPKDLTVETSLHLGAHESLNPRAFDFESDGTEKLVVHVFPFFLEEVQYEFAENYRVDCLQSTSDGNEISLFADYGNEVTEGTDYIDYPLPTTLGGHFKLDGYEGSFINAPLRGPVQSSTDFSCQGFIGTSFYEIWPISVGGPEVITFSIKKMTKLKKGFATFKEIKRFHVRINAVAPFLPVGSDNQETSSNELP